MAALLCLQIIHFWHIAWTLAHQSFQLLCDPAHCPAAPNSRKSMITSSHGPDATVLPGQPGPKHVQTKRLCTPARKPGTPLRVGALPSPWTSQPGRRGVKCSAVQIHTHQSRTALCRTAPAVNHGRAWGRHTICLDPEGYSSWMTVEFLLAGNIYNHLKSSSIVILSRFLHYPGIPVFISNIMESEHVWNTYFS